MILTIGDQAFLWANIKQFNMITTLNYYNSDFKINQR